MRNKKIGDIGEEISAIKLLEKGYTILNRNYYYFGYGEIDIIMTKDNILVFVEVKTRTSKAFSSPKEAVDESKQNKIKKTALKYLNEFEKDFFLRFDVCEVILNKKSLILEEFNHIENAF